MPDLTPAAEVLLAHVKPSYDPPGLGMTFEQAVRAIEQEARAEQAAEVEALRTAVALGRRLLERQDAEVERLTRRVGDLEHDLAVFTEEPSVLARVGAEHTTYWYNQTRLADAKVERLRAALEAFMVAFEDTGVHEHERDDNSIDLCIPIAPLKPVYWAACAAVGHRWTVVDVEPFCERCGFREGDDEDDAAVVQSAEHQPGDYAAVEEAGSSPARGVLESALRTLADDADRYRQAVGQANRYLNEDLPSARALVFSLGRARAAIAATPEPHQEGGTE